MIFATFATAASALALQTAPATPVHTYQGLVISPQGDKVASIDGVEAQPGHPAPHAAIVVRSVRTGAVVERIDPCAPCRYSGLAWSPSGEALAFVAADAKAGTAVVKVSAKGGAHDVATVKGLAQTPRWSPGGDRIAFLAVVGAHKSVGATQPGKALVGEIGSVVDEQRIMLALANGEGKADAVSPADTWIYEYDWTPDGASFVATAAKGDGDNNWWVAKLVAIDPATSGLRVIAAPKMQMNDPRVSPDGKTVAFIGGIMSDFGSVGGDVWTAPLSGGEPTDVTPGYKGSFNAVAWRGSAIRATALIGADAAMTSIDPRTARVTVLQHAPVSLSAGDGHVSLSADGKIAVTVMQDYESAPRIGVHGPDGARALTHDNDAIQPVLHATSITWKSGPFDVQGWLLTPLSYDPKVKHPMITMIHGGPSAASTPGFSRRGTTADLIQHGYFVFEPNPRGSYGQGEAFTRANVRDFGGGDLKDILAGIDAVEKAAPVDDNRLGVTGGSYGGFMTMWTVTQTHRFKAAAAGAGISNWSSYYGENGIDTWMIPFFGDTFYNDPAVYDRLSPIRYIRNAKTPTFIYVGERDVECPAPQSLEYWHGLTEMGVPNSLVIYPGEGHGIRQPENVKDLRERTIAWFDKYLK